MPCAMLTRRCLTQTLEMRVVTWFDHQIPSHSDYERGAPLPYQLVAALVSGGHAAFSAAALQLYAIPPYRMAPYRHSNVTLCRAKQSLDR